MKMNYTAEDDIRSGTIGDFVSDDIDSAMSSNADLRREDVKSG